jgi:hypothetical protein
MGIESFFVLQPIDFAWLASILDELVASLK